MNEKIKKEYDEEGNLRKEAHYLSGKLHGLTTYWKNYFKIAESEFKEGKLHGVSREWYLNGNLKMLFRRWSIGKP